MAKTYSTETEVYAAIRQRFPSPEYATFPSVRDGAGFQSNRTIDAMVFSLWPSRGLSIHGIEIKTNRGDWLKELRSPNKQESIFKRCDRFWLAVGDPKIVLDDEIPETWGLLVPHRGGTLKVKKEAPILKPSAGLDRSFLAAILRRADQGMRDPALEDRIRHELRVEYEKKIADAVASAGRRDEQKIFELNKRLAAAEAFEQKAGIRLSGYANLDHIAEFIRATENLGYCRFMNVMQSRLKYAHAEIQAIDSQIRGSIDALEQLVELRNSKGGDEHE